MALTDEHWAIPEMWLAAGKTVRRPALGAQVSLPVAGLAQRCGGAAAGKAPADRRSAAPSGGAERRVGSDCCS